MAIAHHLRSASLSLLVLLACALPACGGGDGGGEGGSAGSTGTSSTSTDTTGGGNGGDGGTAGAGGNTAGSGGGGGNTGGSGGTTTTTGTGGSPGGPGVACGDLSCALPTFNCCKNYNEPAACIMPGGDCTYGVPLACDGPEDCNAGEVCCAKTYTKGAGNAYEYTSCLGADACTGKDYRVVCGASGECPQGQTCGVSEMLPPYLDCK